MRTPDLQRSVGRSRTLRTSRYTLLFIKYLYVFLISKPCALCTHLLCVTHKSRLRLAQRKGGFDGCLGNLPGDLLARERADATNADPHHEIMRPTFAGAAAKCPMHSFFVASSPRSPGARGSRTLYCRLWVGNGRSVGPALRALGPRKSRSVGGVFCALCIT